MTENTQKALQRILHNHLILMFEEKVKKHQIRSDSVQWTLPFQNALSSAEVPCLKTPKFVLAVSQYLFMKMRHESQGCRDEPWFMTTSRKLLKISMFQDDSKCNKGISNDLVTNVAAELRLFFQQIFSRSMKNDSCKIWTVNVFMLVNSTFCVKKWKQWKEKQETV